MLATEPLIKTLQVNYELFERHQQSTYLKPLLRMRAKIEELKQSTIAEIRSYSDPPSSVGEVMRATFLLLGESYSDMQKWSNIRVLLGKMGKE